MSAWLDFHHGVHRASAYSAWLVQPWSAGHPVRLGYRLSGIAVIVMRHRRRNPPQWPGWRRRADKPLDDWQMAYNRLLSFATRKFFR